MWTTVIQPIRTSSLMHLAASHAAYHFRKLHLLHRHSRVFATCCGGSCVLANFHQNNRLFLFTGYFLIDNASAFSLCCGVLLCRLWASFSGSEALRKKRTGDGSRVLIRLMTMRSLSVQIPALFHSWNVWRFSPAREALYRVSSPFSVWFLQRFF